MKLLSVFILVALLGISLAVDEPSSQTGVSCSAFAALKIRVVGRGRCRGVAGADCVALASSQNDFQEAYNSWWSDGEQCEKVKLEEAAVAIATACASAYAKTIAKVECEGEGGFACGWSISDGSAFASAMARAIAQAAVDAGGVDANAFCVADVEAISGAVAEAAASAESKACVTGEGSQEDFQEAFVETLAEAVAEAFVTATAATCEKEGAAAAKSLCAGEAGAGGTSKETAKATEGAKAESTTGEVYACSAGLDDCCKTDYRGVTCSCTDPDCAGTWMRASDFTGGNPRTWRNPRTREVCQCAMPVV